MTTSSSPPTTAPTAASCGSPTVRPPAPVLVADLGPGLERRRSDRLAALGGLLIFAANDAAHGRELWRSDGTDAGTALVKDIAPGPAGSDPEPLLEVAGTLYFTADDGVHGRELWRTDGTEAGTSLVKDINPSGDSLLWHDPYPTFRSYAVAGDLLLFAADDGSETELWRSDGTEAGTVLVKDIEPGLAAAPTRARWRASRRWRTSSPTIGPRSGAVEVGRHRGRDRPRQRHQPGAEHRVLSN